MFLEGFSQPKFSLNSSELSGRKRTRNSLRMAKGINCPNPQERQLIRLKQLVGNHTTSDNCRVNVLEKIRIQRMKEGIGIDLRQEQTGFRNWRNTTQQIFILYNI